MQAIPIPYLGRDEARDGEVGLGRGGLRQFGRRASVAVEDVVDLGFVHGVVLAQAERQRGIDLNDDDIRLLHQRAHVGGGGGEIVEAVRILRADLENGDVDAINEAAVKVRPFAEIERQVVDQPGIVLAAVIAAEMPIDAERVLTRSLCFQEGARAHGDTGAYLDAAQIGHARGQCLVEDIGLADAEPVIQPHAGCDEAGGFLRRDFPRRLAGFSERHVSPA